MFELEVQSPRHIRISAGRWTVRTWRSWLLRGPAGYVSPRLVFAVEEEFDDEPPVQLAAFFEEDDARRCIEQLTDEGRSNLHINMIAVHDRVVDWNHDR